MGSMERYKFVRLLGKGAAGSVFLVEDKLLGGRRVALKRIKANVDDLLKAAFEREFAIMASLSLPGVARVFDFGIAEADNDQPGGPFYTRTYVGGSPLDLAAQSLDGAGKIRLIAQIADIIAPLHRVGVIHGDIKPGNVIVDQHGATHLIDFGLARLVDRSPSSIASGGTPSFMAPELLRGEPSSIQAEIYALGVTLWMVLVGGDPFENTGRSAVRAKLEGFLPTIPAHCDQITAAALTVAIRALALNPMDRFPTVDEFRVSLDQIDPSIKTRILPRGFVPPRPRGHESILAGLETQINRINSDSQVIPGSEAVLVHGLSGSGKTSLLRELKWRLQLRGFQIFELFAHRGGTVAPVISLLQQALIAAHDEGAARSVNRIISEIANGHLEATATADILASLFARMHPRGPVVVLIDNLDHAEEVVGEILRSAIHGETGKPVALVATATNTAAPAVVGLRVSSTVLVPQLGLAEVGSLAADVLGPADESLVKALLEHSQGVAGVLVDALATLSSYQAPTAADVLALPVGQVGLTIAHSRLTAAPSFARNLLNLLAVAGGSLPAEAVDDALEAIGEAKRPFVDLLLVCENAGLVIPGPDGIAFADRTLTTVILDELGRDRVGAIASRLLGSAKLSLRLTSVMRAHLSDLAGDTRAFQELAPKAARELSALGAYRAAIGLYQQLAEGEGGASSGLVTEAMASLAELYQITGDYQSAVALADKLLANPELSPTQRINAVLVKAQALRALSQFDQAIAALSSVHEISDNSIAARIQREIAQVHLRRGDYESAAAAAKRGLAQVASDDPLRIELLTALGLVASYRGHHETARVHYQEALTLARSVGSKRDQANALTCLAVGHQRASEYGPASELFSQSLAIARELGDIGGMATFALNSGAMCFMLGEPARSVEHYEAAIKLARRAGRVSTYCLGRNNLALLHVYLGLYERARVELDEVLASAQKAGLKYVAAQATGALGDLAARTGDVDTALRQYDAAIARYLEIGQNREIAEAHLDAAEALLDRDGPTDVSVAAARLAEARGHIEREKLDDFKLRLELLLARALCASGDSQAAIGKLETVIRNARASNDRELEWRALSAAALSHESQGADFMARRYDRKAIEVLEQIALAVPQEHRQAFWYDIRRREVRRRASLAGDSTRHVAPPESDGSGAIDARIHRLLEIIKRLASEHDLDRLLERITESAVDLSGAERGLVLLVNGGKLETKTISYANAAKPDSHIAFSRSIAEAVLIDGEPIISMDAADDRRLAEYLSVHQLMLRSVACLPIQGGSGPVGVLYLEHRRRKGRFRDADLELLVAFADQAAIALENARLLAENSRRREELERVNADLLKTRQEMEELLIVRTEALDEAKRQLEHSQHRASAQYVRHGMVGRSPQMQRLFDTIDRVRHVPVPVVIQGESGTGKELVARAIHYGGPRAKAPFVAINCASIPESLLESELFGHVKGAFTGADRHRAGLIARAEGGTLLLDEIGDMPLKMQVELLRVIQEGSVRPIGGDQEMPIRLQFIATSAVPLPELVSSGRFRQDLYYRLSVVEISIPPLRERREDIPILCEYFLQNLAARYQQPLKHLSPKAISLLCGAPWPGNVRQLEHVLLNAWVLVDGSIISDENLALEGRTSSAPGRMRSTIPSVNRGRSEAPASRSAGDFSKTNGDESLNESEKNRILRVLESNGWNKVKAAQTLGMARRTLYRRLHQYGIGQAE
jgi:transcriptional regulator with GAF, ATPase, and Fis domain/serine/threonine protein kinase/tetratricopeptide (TPR) repeat protein